MRFNDRCLNCRQAPAAPGQVYCSKCAEAAVRPYRQAGAAIVMIAAFAALMVVWLAATSRKCGPIVREAILASSGPGLVVGMAIGIIVGVGVGYIAFKEMGE